MALIEEVNALVQRNAEELKKYTYFLLAVSGAAIGYALNAAEGKPFSCSSLLLIFALGVWSLSFIFGIRHLKNYRLHMIENAKSLLCDETAEQMLNRLEPIAQRMELASNLQYWSLIIGAISYVVWFAIRSHSA